MTIKTRKLIKHLADSKTIREASIKAGYAPKSNKPYQKGIRRYIQEALKCEPDSVRSHFEGLYDKCMLKGDYATAKGVLDSICRITGMNQDKLTVSALSPQDITPEKLSEARKALELPDKSMSL